MDYFEVKVYATLFIHLRPLSASVIIHFYGNDPILGQRRRLVVWLCQAIIHYYRRQSSTESFRKVVHIIYICICSYSQIYIFTNWFKIFSYETLTRSSTNPVADEVLPINRIILFDAADVVVYAFMRAERAMVFASLCDCMRPHNAYDTVRTLVRVQRDH